MGTPLYQFIAVFTLGADIFTDTIFENASKMFALTRAQTYYYSIIVKHATKYGYTLTATRLFSDRYRLIFRTQTDMGINPCKTGCDRSWEKCKTLRVPGSMVREEQPQSFCRNFEMAA